MSHEQAKKAEQAKKDAEQKESMNEKGMFTAESSDSEDDLNDWTSSDEDDPDIAARRCGGTNRNATAASPTHPFLLAKRSCAESDH
eukprot:COSAG06_NODE_10716_length_1630_cov_1.812541_3_plen_86_part_00